MRFTAKQYNRAIADLKLAKRQLSPDGGCCSVCGDSGHMAYECGFNPLVAMALCEAVAKQSDKLHEILHYLAGYNSHMGEQIGPAKIILPEKE